MVVLVVDVLLWLKIITSKFWNNILSFLFLIITFSFYFFFHRQGGLGEAVLSALADKRDFVVKHLFVPTVPRSGPPTVLIDMFGISARHVVSAANAVLKL